MISLFRCVVFSLVFIATAAYSQVKPYPMSEHKKVYQTSDVSDVCGKLSVNVDLGTVTIELKSIIGDDATVSANVDGTTITDLAEEDIPGKALSGKKVRFTSNIVTEHKSANNTIILLSRQLSDAISANKTVAVTVQPGQNSFDKGSITINYPAIESLNCK